MRDKEVVLLSAVTQENGCDHALEGTNKQSGCIGNSHNSQPAAAIPF